MATIRSHEDLVAWQLSDNLEDHVYEITARPDAQKDHDFCDDIQRSARSAPANLSEGFHRYRPRDNARLVRIALGSIGETLNHLRHAWKRKYITEQEYTDWKALAQRAHDTSSAWLAYLDSCSEAAGPPRKGQNERRTNVDPGTNPEPGTNTEPGTRNDTRNPEPGTRNKRRANQS